MVKNKTLKALNPQMKVLIVLLLSAVALANAMDIPERNWLCSARNTKYLLQNFHAHHNLTSTANYLQHCANQAIYVSQAKTDLACEGLTDARQFIRENLCVTPQKLDFLGTEVAAKFASCRDYFTFEALEEDFKVLCAYVNES